VVAQSGHFPYGEQWYATGSSSKWIFTTYQRDFNSGNDYAMARYYASRLGRFASPDPLGGSISDPQSLNRYSYARSDSVNLIDPSGRDWYNFNPYLLGFLLGTGTTVEVTGSPVLGDWGFGGDVGPRRPTQLLPNGDFDPRSEIRDLPVTPRKFSEVNVIPPCADRLAQSLDSYLEGTRLAGWGPHLVEAGDANNVDPRVVVAIAGAETGFGQNVTRGFANYWNWTWNTEVPSHSGFPTLAVAIDTVSAGLGGRGYLGARKNPPTNTASLYVNRYCFGADCANGLKNINTFLTEQGGNPNQLHFPCP
jgi:RHS repeat-associated protein